MPQSTCKEAPPKRGRAKKRSGSLYYHKGSGQWAKRIHGRTWYFGTEEKAALARYTDEKDALYAGRNPRAAARQAASDGLTTKELCDRFIAAKESDLVAGDLTAQRTVDDYVTACQLVVAEFGPNRYVGDLGPDDFRLFRTNLTSGLSQRRRRQRYSIKSKERKGEIGRVTLWNYVTRIKVIFNYAAAEEWIPKAVNFGKGFKRPGSKAVRIEKSLKGKKLFTAEQVRAIIEKAPQPLKAMAMLAINGGVGNADLARLQLDALDLETGWLDFPRGKTGVERRVPLWKETIDCLREAIARRKPKREDAYDLVFVTRQGTAWAGQAAITHEFRKVLDAVGAHQPGIGLYTMRHVVATVGGEAKDPIAVAAILGHIDGTVQGIYREGISDERLRQVTDRIHQWLYSPAEGTKPL